MAVKQKKETTFETKQEELSSILESLKKSNLNLKDITAKVKLAKEIYADCKKELEEARLIISEIKSSE